MGRHWMTRAGARLLWAAPGEGGPTLEAAALLGATGESRVVSLQSWLRLAMADFLAGFLAWEASVDQRLGRRRGLREFGRGRLQMQGGGGEAPGARALPGGVSWYRRGVEVLQAAPGAGGVCRARALGSQW